MIGVAPSRGSWETIMDPWWMARPAGFTGTLDVAVPLWQEDGDLATAAAGGYDAQWEQLGKLIESQYPGSTVRPGWEFNLGGWSHHADEGNVEQWKQAFRHASTALKKGGPSLLVTFNPNKGKGDSLPDATKAWPGDDVVDIVGLDAYDWWPAYSQSTWPKHRDEDQGWAYWVDFARQHGKKFGVPEWGVAPGNDHGGGDNPYYMGAVVDYLAAEHAKDAIVHHVVYFDEKAGYIANSIGDGQVPQAGAAYREAMELIASKTQPQAKPVSNPSPAAAPATTPPAPAPGPQSPTPPTQPEETAVAAATKGGGGQVWSGQRDAQHGPVPGDSDG